MYMCFWRIFRFVSRSGQECAKKEKRKKKVTAQEAESRKKTMHDALREYVVLFIHR